MLFLSDNEKEHYELKNQGKIHKEEHERKFQLTV